MTADKDIAVNAAFHGVAAFVFAASVAIHAADTSKTKYKLRLRYR